MTIEEVLDKARRSDVLGMENQVREAMLAVLEEARGCAGHFAANPPGSCVCASCSLRTRIKELGGNDGQG